MANLWMPDGKLLPKEDDSMINYFISSMISSMKGPVFNRFPGILPSFESVLIMQLFLLYKPLID